MIYPVTYLTACSRTDVSSYNEVFNTKDIPYYLWISITKEIASDFSLFAMHEISAKCNRNIAIDSHAGIVQTQGTKPWIRINTDGVSHAIGMHIYKLSFVHKITGDVVDRYFSYTIQCDDPCKPYDYMEGRCRCYGCINCNPCK